LAEKPKWSRWWNSLSYRRNDVELNPGQKHTLGSLRHSSDSHQGGVTPYWIVGKNTQLHFAVAWCGGWKANLANNDNCLDYNIHLPPEETQLVLKPNETITGPMVYVTVINEPDEAKARCNWLLQRARLARKLYGGPPIWYPFHYNHWYSSRFAIDETFLKNQVDAMERYGFDAFVVDAGWYEKMGFWDPVKKCFSWHANPKKFKPGRFAELMAEAGKKGAVPGIWTAPQLVNAPNKQVPPYIKEPVNYNQFSRGYALDMAVLDFKTHLLKHIQHLRDSYHCGWWKYDQSFFYEKSRSGLMKNVDAFQKALLAVRAAHPELHIEGCMGGGRMINELTLLATQSHWLLDGGHTGRNHARQNIVVALGSMDIVFPWAATRWNNNPNKNDPNDDEFTKFYCRSAMAGIWGISADLSLIGDRQKAVILKEVPNYRRLNKLKSDCLYDLYLPGKAGGIAGVTFYKASGGAAGILLYRWDRNGEFEYSIGLSKLNPALQYRTENVDSGQIEKISGKILVDQGLRIPFKPKQQSAVVFIESIR
ncbi:MAG: alpha-galactosidase, partial [Planctomycetota bacterium]|jgi:alpha-galactosidase